MRQTSGIQTGDIRREMGFCPDLWGSCLAFTGLKPGAMVGKGCGYLKDSSEKPE